MPIALREQRNRGTMNVRSSLLWDMRRCLIDLRSIVVVVFVAVVAAATSLSSLLLLLLPTSLSSLCCCCCCCCCPKHFAFNL